MSSVLTSDNKPHFKDDDTEGGQPSNRAGNPQAGFQNSSMPSSSCAANSEFGEIPIEFLPVDREDFEHSDTEHDGLDQVQWTSIYLPNFANILSPSLVDTQPLFLVFIRTLQAAVCTFGPLGCLKVINPSYSMGIGCVVAGIIVGIVFLKHLSAYLRPKLTGGCGYTTLVLNWLHSHPHLSHYFSFRSTPFDLGETLRAGISGNGEYLFIQGTTFDSWCAHWSYFVNNFVFPRDLLSIVRILNETFMWSACALVPNFMILYVAPSHKSWQYYPDFLFTTTIMVATFVKKTLAYLRPGHPLLWLYLMDFVNLIISVLPCVSIFLCHSADMKNLK